MSIRMKALKTFEGRPDEGERGLVRAGHEFTVAQDARAKELELGGKAVPLVASLASSRAANLAAIAGPLPSRGGRAGAAKSRSSSRPVPAPAKKKPAKLSRRRR